MTSPVNGQLYNSPILVGAIVAHLVKRSTKDEVLAGARYNRGIVLASGLIAGGALVGVLSAVVNMLSSSLGRRRKSPAVVGSGRPSGPRSRGQLTWER